MNEGTEKDHESRRPRRRHTPSRAAKVHAGLDRASELLIYGILIFTPWAFGSTEHWAIRSVNTWNFLLGGLLVSKWAVRLLTGYHPDRVESEVPSKWGHRLVTWALALMTLFLLGFCWVSAWNARADFDFFKQLFEYRNYIKWLPASYDSSATWTEFYRYFAAACFFWSLRDWLLTQSSGDSTQERTANTASGDGRAYPRRLENRHATRLPARTRRLLWVLCLNGAALAVEGILQRFSGTSKLLWLVLPFMNATPDAQFGPFNYRSNGAQYLNMLWPVCLGFWWALNNSRRTRLGEGPEPILLPLASILLAGPIISLSRGGIAIAFIEAVASTLLFAYCFRGLAWWKTILPAALLAIAVALFTSIEWDRIRTRFNENSMNTMSGRSEIYRDAQRIAEDFPIFGTGPGTFPVMYYMYRSTPNQMPMAFTHDDFLQTLVTFGRVGLAAVGVTLVLVFAYWFYGRGVPVSGPFAGFLWVGLAGCLAHAKFDFPFQIYSLLLLFLTICALLTTVSRR